MNRPVSANDASPDVGAIPTSPRAANWPSLPRSVVKSAGRALQILEYFDETHREAKMVDIARALHYPESSTSILLRSLAAIGYIDYDRQKRTYHPTSRVRILGNWVDAPLFEKDRILRLMDDLNAETGDVVFLAARNGLNAQYVHVVQTKTALDFHLPPGALRPLTISAAGWALLSPLPDLEIAKIVRRANADAACPSQTIKVSDVLSRIACLRADGYIATRSNVTPGASVLVAPLPSGLTKSPLVIGLGGPSVRMEPRAHELAALLRGRIKETFSA